MISKIKDLEVGLFELVVNARKATNSLRIYIKDIYDIKLYLVENYIDRLQDLDNHLERLTKLPV